MHEPVTNCTKAGDLAPDVVFTKVLNVPGSSKWSPENLTGRLTVLATCSDISSLYSVTEWNTLIDQFARQSVQFIWMTGEEESTLLPWLSRHPVKGWVFYDPSGETRKAYGVEFPEYVIIGADRRIVGFANILTAAVLNGVLEGRITRWASREGKSSTASNLVFLQAEPSRWPPAEDPTPGFPPSSTLHVSPSPREGWYHSVSPGFLNIKGCDLRDAIQDLYGVERTRIDLAASLDDGKLYDFALCLPGEESEETTRDHFRQGVEDYFNITARRESRLLDAYIVTATERQPPRCKVDFFNRTSRMGFLTMGGCDGYPAPGSIDCIRTAGFSGTLDDFCQMLETTLDRPVVNETNLQGEFEFKVKGAAGTASDFLERLRDQTGLLITSAQRNVELVVVRPR